MAEPIGAIRALLSASAAVFEQDMKRARNAVDRSSRDMRTSFERIQDGAARATKNIFSMRSGLALIAGATGLFYATKKAIEFADAIGKSSKAAGQTAEEYQSYAYAAGLAGISQEDYTKAVSKFAIVVGKARRAAKGLEAELFQSIGIDRQTLATKTQSELLDILADKFSKVSDPARMASVAVELFGKSGIRMGQFLAQGSKEIESLRVKAAELGLVLSNETVANAEAAGDELETLGKVIKIGLTNALLQFAPLIKDVAKTLQDPRFVSGLRDIADGIDGLFDVIGSGIGLLSDFNTKLDELAFGVRGAASQIGADLKDAFNKALEGDFSGMTQSPFELLMRGAAAGGMQIEYFKQQMDAYNRSMKDGILANAEFGASVDGGILGDGGLVGGMEDFGNEIDKTTESLAKNTDALKFKNVGLQQLIERYRDFHSTVEELQDDIDLETQAIQQNIKLNSEAGRAWINAERENRRLQRAFNDQKKVLDEIRTPLESYTEEVDRLQELLKMGALNQEQFNKAMEKAKERYEKAKQEANGLAETGKEVGSAFQDAFGKMLTGAESVKDSLKGLAKALIDIALRKAILEPAGAALGNVFGSIFGSFGGGKASGGPVFPGKTYLVGENGPELFRPPATGAIVPNHEMTGGGNVYNIDARGASDATVARLEAMLLRLAGPGVVEARVNNGLARGKIG